MVEVKMFGYQIRPDSTTIAVVSDEDDTTLDVAKCLSGHGFTVVQLSSDEDIWTGLQAAKADLVLMDIALPVGAALELTVRMSMDKVLKESPVVIMSPLAEAGDLVVAIDAGCAEFVGVPINPLELYARVTNVLQARRMFKELESAETILSTLAMSVEAKDGTTGDHCDRLARNAVIFGRAISCNREEIQALRNGGYLHDIGKIAIPDAILNKPGKLNDEEWVVMRSHVTVGEELCQPLSTMQHVLPIIRHHHERFNGTGYPDKISGNDIPKLARLFQIADVYDALTSPRPYKTAFTVEKAVSIMKEESANGFSDPDLAEIYFGLVAKGRIEIAPEDANNAKYTQAMNRR